MADRELNLISWQVDHTGRRDELEIDIGVFSLKNAELRDKPCSGERRRQRKTHNATARGRQQGLGRRLDLSYSGLDLFQIPPASIRQLGASARSINQRRLQKLLQPFHLMADRRFG